VQATTLPEEGDVKLYLFVSLVTELACFRLLPFSCISTLVVFWMIVSAFWLLSRMLSSIILFRLSVVYTALFLLFTPSLFCIPDKTNITILRGISLQSCGNVKSLQDNMLITCNGKCIKVEKSRHTRTTKYFMTWKAVVKKASRH